MKRILTTITTITLTLSLLLTSITPVFAYSQPKIQKGVPDYYEQEPNDNISHANVIQLNQTVHGVTDIPEYPGLRDYFKISLNQDGELNISGSVTVDENNPPSQSKDPNGDFFINLYDSNEKNLGFGSPIKKDGVIIGQQLKITLTKGTYYIKIDEFMTYDRFPYSFTTSFASSSPNVPATSISIDNTYLLLKPDYIRQLVATVLPSNNTNQNLTWESSDNSVVTVNQNGLIKAIDVGKAIITVSTDDGSKTAKCVVNVMSPSTVKSIKASKTSVSLSKGKSQDIVLNATLYDKTTWDVSINTGWTSSKPSVAKVTIVDGVVKINGLSKGSATITGDYYGKKVNVKVTVR